MPKLHYAYEKAATGKARFIYYCSGCSCVVEVRRGLGPANTFNGLCKGCGSPLEGGVECSLGPVPPEWYDVFVDPLQPVQRAEALFQTASSIPHFSLGFSKLDSMLRPMSRGRLIVLTGGPSSAVAELAAFRAQLPVEAGGLNSAVLFIDGGNRSDPYLFSAFARQKGVRPSAAMRRVSSCRVFTCYQLAALVSEHLVRAVEDYGTRLVIISDALGTLNEPELDEREARRILKAIGEGIEEAKKRALVVATLTSPNRYDDIVTSWSDTLVRLSPEGDNVEAELLRHRNRLPGSTRFRQSQLLRAASVGARR